MTAHERPTLPNATLSLRSLASLASLACSLRCARWWPKPLMRRCGSPSSPRWRSATSAPCPRSTAPCWSPCFRTCAKACAPRTPPTFRFGQRGTGQGLTTSGKGTRPAKNADEESGPMLFPRLPLHSFPAPPCPMRFPRAPAPCVSRAPRPMLLPCPPSPGPRAFPARPPLHSLPLSASLHRTRRRRTWLWRSLRRGASSIRMSPTTWRPRSCGTPPPTTTRACVRRSSVSCFSSRHSARTASRPTSPRRSSSCRTSANRLAGRVCATGSLGRTGP